MKRNSFFGFLIVFALLIMNACGAGNSGGETTTEEQTTAQSQTNILPFVKDKKLSNDDIMFLDLVTSGGLESARGDVSSISINETSYEAGQVISNEDAQQINKAISAYFESAGDDVTTSNKAEVIDGSARGCGYYCYYYYYDYWCNCYEYVWYYCCL